MDVLASIPRTSPRVCGLTPTALHYRFTQLFKKNNLSHIGLHSLRHTNASVMLSTGAPDKYVMDLGGWTTPTIMKNVYQHTMDDTMRAVTTVRNNYFGALDPDATSKKPPRKYKIVRYPKDLKNSSK